MPRTTIKISEEQRELLDRLPYGQLRGLFSGLLDCTEALIKRYSAKYGPDIGERQAIASIQSGVMQLTEKETKGG